MAVDLGGAKLEVTGDGGAFNVPIDDLRRYWPQGVGRNAELDHRQSVRRPGPVKPSPRRMR